MKLAATVKSAPVRLIAALTNSTLAFVLAITPFASALGKAGGMVQSYAVESAVYKLYAQGVDLYNAHNYAEARDVLLKAAASDPTSYSSDIHEVLGSTYSGLKQYDKAISEAKTALKFDPENYQAIYDIADAYADQGNSKEAKIWLGRYVNSQPNEAAKTTAQNTYRKMVSYANLSAATKLLEKKKYQAAVKLLDEAAQQDPTEYSGHIHGALCYALPYVGQAERAVSEGKKSIQFETPTASLLYAISCACSEAGRWDEAISYYKQYMAVDKDDSQESLQHFYQCLLEDKKRASNPCNKDPDYLKQIQSEDEGTALWKPDRFPLKVYIAPGTGVTGYKSHFPDYVKRSFDTWCQATGGRMSYKIVKSAADADIKVEFTTKSLENVGFVVPAGLTCPQMDGDGNFVSCEIFVKTNNVFKPSEMVADGECASVCMHEVGHALGLQAHSSNRKDLMYYRPTELSSCVPTSRDKATLAKLYSKYPVIGFQPLLPPEVGVPKEYLPPPTFLPPKLPNKDRPLPPFFMPPPLKKERRLEPPVYTPPPLSAAQKANTSGAQPQTRPSVPGFLPPPLSKKKPSPDRPLFTPPPIK